MILVLREYVVNDEKKQLNQEFFLSKFSIRNVNNSIESVVVLVIDFSINTSTNDIKG